MSIRGAETDVYGAGVTPMANGHETGADAENSFSVIDRHSNFDGIFRSSRDLRIEGEVKGTIECQGTLFVAQGANASAKVEAENVTVAGDLNGDVRCLGRLHIMPSGRVRGKVSTNTLVVNEGAYYEGQLEMTPPEERAGSPAAAAPRQLTPKPAERGPVPIQQTPPPAPAAAKPAPESSGASASTFIRRLGGPETPWDARGDQPEAISAEGAEESRDS